MSLIFVILARVMWQIKPNFLSCLTFWLVVFINQWQTFNITSSITYLGVLSNAIVTLANSGHMPVNNMDTSFSLWVKSNKYHRLTFLSDTLPAGFSIGDVLILGGLIISFIITLVNS